MPVKPASDLFFLFLFCFTLEFIAANQIIFMINYHLDFETKRKVMQIIDRLNMRHVDPERIVCIRSVGSRSRNILARCHVLPRIMQKALNTEPHYVIELVSEKFDKLSEEEKIKTLIHELLHIPKAFGGGFRHHDYVSKRVVESMYKKLKENELSGRENV